MLSDLDKANPEGKAKQCKAKGLISYSSKSIMKTEPLGFSIEVSPKGPESVKKRQFKDSQKATE